MTSVSFQPYTNPMTIPATNVENHWKKLPILSPIPSITLLTSLKEREHVTNDGWRSILIGLKLQLTRWVECWALQRHECRTIRSPGAWSLWREWWNSFYSSKFMAHVSRLCKIVGELEDKTEKDIAKWTELGLNWIDSFLTTFHEWLNAFFVPSFANPAPSTMCTYSHTVILSLVYVYTTHKLD